MKCTFLHEIFYNSQFIEKSELTVLLKDRSRAAATSKMERFVIIVNGFQPLTIITKRSILDVEAALDPPLLLILYFHAHYNTEQVDAVRNSHCRNVLKTLLNM